MEEDKKIIGSEQSNLLEGKNNSTPLPGVGTQYNEESTTENKVELPEKIPNSLFYALSNRGDETIEDIEELIKNGTIEIDIKELVDKDGNPRTLTKREDRLALAISSELSKHREEKSIKELIDKIENGDKIEDNEYIAHFFVPLPELCRKVYGKEDMYKQKKQDKMEDELKKLSEIKQIITFPTREKVGKDEHGNILFEPATYQGVDPFIKLSGRTRQKEGKKGRRFVKYVELIVGRVFLERIEKRSVPILDSYWELKDSKGRKINTAIFNELTKLINRLRWSHLYVELPRVEKYIQDEQILDTEKIQALRKKALTHAPISVEKIKKMTELNSYSRETKEGVLIVSRVDYTSSRKRKKDFWRELWEALRAFIVYGIITTDTKIDKEKGEVILVYNADFATPKQTSLPISGGYWEENPFK